MKEYNFSFALYKLRTDRNLEKEELADMAKVSKSMLIMTERGSRNNPGSQQLARIANALGITMQYIFDLAELAPPNWKAPRERKERKPKGGIAV